MKKQLFILMFFFCNYLMAQQSVSVTGPSTVEVGQTYYYNCKFNPVYPSNQYGDQADDFVITLFSIQTGTNCSSGVVAGAINNIANQCYYSDGTFDSPGERNIPIKWSSGGLTDDYVLVKFSGYYRISNTNEVISYFNWVEGDMDVTVQRLHTPVTISGPATIADCSQAAVTFSLSNAYSVNGNQYQWTATNGTIVGSATGTSVSIAPNLTGSVMATLKVRRSGADPNYFVTGSKTVSRTPFTSAATITGNSTICTSRTYTLSGLQPGETVAWSLSNSTAVSMTSSGTSATVTKTGGGSVTLSATITNSCGTQSVVKTKMLYAGSPPAVHWSLGMQEDHSCDIKYHYVPIIFKIPVGVSLTFPYMSPSVTYTSQNIGFEQYLYKFAFPKNYSGYFDFFAKYTNSCGYTIRDVYQEIEIRSCAQLGLGITAAKTTNSFVVYPNPAKDHVAIKLNKEGGESPSDETVSAELFDMVGVSRASVKLRDSQGIIGMENLPRGIYILKIYKGEAVEHHHILKE